MVEAADIEGVQVVLVGSFNPAIFQPQWFARQHLVRPEEAEGESCQIEIVRPEITVCTMGPFRYVVDPIRFEVSTDSLASMSALRDLVLNTFGVLEHTPITEMGVNRFMHFKMASEEEWHGVGNRLVPKEIWKGLVTNPGMQTIQVAGSRDGSPAARWTITVQPSQRMKPGVFVSTNEHFMVGKDEAQRLLSMLRDHWESAQRAAREVATQLLRRCTEETPNAHP